MQAMILAAGLGTRLRPFSLLRPKPLFPVFDLPLLELLLRQLQDAGFEHLIVNAHHLAGQVRNYLAGRESVTILVEQDILGTGGGLRNALSYLRDEPLLVINGDIVHNLDLREIYRTHLESGASVSMVAHQLLRFTSLAVDGRNRIVGIGDERPMSASLRHLAFTGIHLIDPALLAEIPPAVFYSIIDLYRRLIASGSPPRAIVVENHYWRDMGTVEDYLLVHAELIRRPDLLASYFSGIDPHGYISPYAKIHPSTRIIDWAVIGAGAEICEDVVLERTVLWDNALVPAKSRFSDTVVGERIGDETYPLLESR